MKKYTCQQLKMKSSTMYSAATVLLIFLCLLSCSKEKNKENNNGDSQGYSIPSISGGGSCASIPSAPDGCVWALSTDAVVFGTLRDIRRVEYPAVLRHLVGDPPVLVEELVYQCDGFITPAMELDVAIERTLHGNIRGLVTVRIGTVQLDSYNPHPSWDSNGHIEWTNVGGAHGDPLVIGQKIGLGIYYDQTHSLWTTGNEFLFTVRVNEDANEVTSFQRVNDDCREPPPADFEGIQISELAGAISGCSEQSARLAEDRRRKTEIGPNTPPEWYMASICTEVPEELQPGQCASDTDCTVDGQKCISGICAEP